MNKEKMEKWYLENAIEISSNTIWCALMGKEPVNDDAPYDRLSFARCVDLYRYAELTADDLETVARKYPYYGPIIQIWDKLCEIHEGKRNGSIYDTLFNLNPEIMKIRGFRQTEHGFWVK